VRIIRISVIMGENPKSEAGALARLKAKLTKLYGPQGGEIAEHRMQEERERMIRGIKAEMDDKPLPPTKEEEARREQNE
jgi:hypothetical protein